MEQWPVPNQENLGDQELKKDTIDLLRKNSIETGFVETPAMQHLRENILTEHNAKNMEAIKPLFVSWTEAAQESISGIAEQDPYMKAQIGLLIVTSTLYLELDIEQEAADELYSAAEYARQYRLDDLSKSLYDHATILDGTA